MWDTLNMGGVRFSLVEEAAGGAPNFSKHRFWYSGVSPAQSFPTLLIAGRKAEVRK